MATLTAKLTVTGSAADYGAAFSLSQSNTLDVTSPSKGVSRLDVSAADTAVLKSDSGADGTVFCYVKNNNSSGTASIDLQTDNGNNTFGTLNNGEFAWIPIDSNEGIQVLGVDASVEVEYAFWSRT